MYNLTWLRYLRLKTNDTSDKVGLKYLSMNSKRLDPVSVYVKHDLVRKSHCWFNLAKDFLCTPFLHQVFINRHQASTRMEKIYRILVD